MKRAHTFWFSDQTEQQHLCRYMQARANRFLPGHLLNSSVAVKRGQGDAGFDDTSIHARMLGKLAFDGDIASWSEPLTSRMAYWVQIYKGIRHLVVQDFYQLLSQPTCARDWDAVQFASYGGDEAVVFVFSGSEGGRRMIPLYGLDPNGGYALEWLPGRQQISSNGCELLERGIAADLERWDSCMIKMNRA